LVAAARRAAGDPVESSTGWREAAGLILAWPLLWALGAFLLRGSASLLLMRMAVARINGCRATRLQCAVRGLVVWVPVALLLAASVAVYGQAPALLGLRSLLWWGALGLTAGYLFVAVSMPERAPHDRWLGLQLVPL